MVYIILYRRWPSGLSCILLMQSLALLEVNFLAGLSVASGPKGPVGSDCPTRGSNPKGTRLGQNISPC